MGGEPRWAEAVVRRGKRGWRVVIPAAEGAELLEYQYATKKQAAYFHAVFQLGPTWYPKPHAVRRAKTQL